MSQVDTRVQTGSVAETQVPEMLQSIKAGARHLRTQALDLLVMLDALDAEIDTAITLYGIDCL